MMEPYTYLLRAFLLLEVLGGAPASLTVRCAGFKYLALRSLKVFQSLGRRISFYLEAEFL